MRALKLQVTILGLIVLALVIADQQQPDVKVTATPLSQSDHDAIWCREAAKNRVAYMSGAYRTVCVGSR